MRQTIFSGIQPSGNPHLGNYLGAIRNWVSLQDSYNTIYSIVDLHSLTVRQDPAELRVNCRNLFTLLIACGLDPKKNIIYYQSNVRAHAQLAWILSCYTYFGELNRQVQFKEKSNKHEENVNAGLFTYPVLQAADILLFGSHLVPVGEDQRQHLELSRDVAIRFNNIYGDIFVVPKAHIAKTGARVMSLSDPERKMSKSDLTGDNGIIYLQDDDDTIVNKFKKAVTDSFNKVVYGADRPGVSNLMTIYSAFTGKTVEETEAEFEGVGYGTFKKAVAEAVIEILSPIRKEYKCLSDDKSYIDDLLKKHTERANSLAEETLNKVEDAIGLQKGCIL